jgi:hypothetical protein
MASTAGAIFDGLPLSEDIVQYTLSVMVLVMRQTSSASERARTIGLMYNEHVPDFHSVDAAGLTSISPSATVAGGNPGTTRSGGPDGSIGKGSTVSSAETNSPSWSSPGAASIPPLPSSAYPFAAGMNGPSKPLRPAGHMFTNTTPALTSLVAPAAACYSDTPGSLSWLVYRYAARVVFYISSSNWDAVYTRVRGWIRAANASASGSGVDEMTDTMDVRLMTCSAVDSTRLGNILAGKLMPAQHSDIRAY